MWLLPADEPGAASADLAIIGVPAHLTSITPTGAHATPDAIRDALLRYSTYAGARGIDVSRLSAADLGDIANPDGAEGELRVRARVGELIGRHELLVAIGGDNSITYPVMSGLFGESLGEVGLITIDAHHDLRDGDTNGSPVRRLVAAGLPGANIVQLGIADFSNSPAYAARAAELGVTVIARDELRRRPLGQLMAYALERAGLDGRHVYVDIDVDVCDRAVVPGCPSAAPGGISADELRQIAFLAGRDPRVQAIDITEIDATTDARDGRTVRLGALLVLEAAAGLAARLAARA
jgi:formiminoglutamase